MSPPVAWALRYAEMGFKVFPAWIFKGDDKRWVKAPMSRRHGLIVPCHLHPNGKPKAEAKSCSACLGGHNAATLDPGVIQRYWAGFRSRCQVAVLPPPGVIIIDDDSHVFDHRWSDRPRVRTASGKSHYYFNLMPHQDVTVSENGIVYTEPDGKIDIRVGDGKRYVFAPCGTEHYLRINRWTPDPVLLPPLPDDVYERLRVAPREIGEGGLGGGGGKFPSGLPNVPIGLPYDYDSGAAEELLERHGWTYEGGGRWARPGGSGASATLLITDDGLAFFAVHTTSDPLLLGGHKYTPSMLLAVLDHDSNWSECWSAMKTNTHEAAKEAFK